MVEVTHVTDALYYLIVFVSNTINYRALTRLTYLQFPIQVWFSSVAISVVGELSFLLTLACDLGLSVCLSGCHNHDLCKNH